MVKVTFKIKEFAKSALPHLQSIFIYNLNKQLEANGLSTTNVIPYTVMQGFVQTDCASSYDKIRVDQIVATVVRQLNLFDTENGNFENYTDAEKENLRRLLTERNSDSKKHVYYKAIKELMKQKIYPPYSLQETLINEAMDFVKADIVEETEPEETILKHVSLQTSSWLWTRVVNVFPNNPLRKEAVYLATELDALGIESIEELNLMTSTLYKFITLIGAGDCYRIAIQPEVANIANIRNAIRKKIEVYQTITDKYLTCCVAALFARNMSSIKTIYEILNSTTCNINYDLRFSDLKALAEIADNHISQNLVEERWAKFVVANRDVVANIITAIGLKAKQLYPLWKASREVITYPEDFDELQVYYEGQNLDIDTLSNLLSIDAEEGDIKQMLQVIKKAGVKHPSEKLAYDIATQMLKRKTSLSDKQYAIIEKRYSSIMKTAEMAKTIDAEECMRLATELNAKFKGQLNATAESIVNSTLRYGICSERQLEVLRLTYLKLTSEQGGQQEQNTPQMSADGLMFNLPTAQPTVAPKVEQTDAEKKEEAQLRSTTKHNMTKDIKDAYRRAFSDASQGSSGNADSSIADNSSIWDD